MVAPRGRSAARISQAYQSSVPTQAAASTPRMSLGRVTRSSRVDRTARKATENPVELPKRAGHAAAGVVSADLVEPADGGSVAGIPERLELGVPVGAEQL